MAARNGLLEDLMEFGSRLKPRVAFALAALSYIVLHAVYVETSPGSLPQATTSIGPMAQRSLAHLIAGLFQYIVPFCLMVGILAYILHRRRGKGLLERARAGGATTVATISWEAFEHLVGAAFRERGYSVKENSSRGPDGGIDLRLNREGKCYLVQCKHWKKSQVGVAVVRELAGVIAVERATGGFVVTTGTFTREARDFARDADIELWDGKALSVAIRGRQIARPDREVEASEVAAPACPKCGCTMVERQATRGKFSGRSFWGCARYPKCTEIKQIT